VFLELLAKGMPLNFVDRSPGGLFVARLGYGTSAVVFDTSPSVYACSVSDHRPQPAYTATDLGFQRLGRTDICSTRIPDKDMTLLRHC